MCEKRKKLESRFCGGARGQTKKFYLHQGSLPRRKCLSTTVEFFEKNCSAALQKRFQNLDRVIHCTRVLVQLYRIWGELILGGEEVYCSIDRVLQKSYFTCMLMIVENTTVSR